MQKQCFTPLFLGIALTVAATGITMVGANSSGYSMTLQVHTGCSGGGGGGC